MEEREAVVNAIVRSLKKYAPEAIKITVIGDQISHINGRWYVPVIPTPTPKNMYSLYDNFADVEIDLEDNERLLVTLIPDLDAEPVSPVWPG